MWPYLLAGLLVACASGWLWTWRRQQERIRQLERSNEEIQVEETLVFDFLHGLGAAFTETIRASDLHRLIVEGATRILDAHGGALYVIERGGARLLPAFISKGCPPLIDVPPHIIQQAASTPVALDSYLRTHNVKWAKEFSDRVHSEQAALLSDVQAAPELAKLRAPPSPTTS
jgi:sigma-B regulation protein RsbU (phosphoserine phosphatase)